jgi:hypothetical protein
MLNGVEGGAHPEFDLVLGFPFVFAVERLFFVCNSAVKRDWHANCIVPGQTELFYEVRVRGWKLRRYCL